MYPIMLMLVFSGFVSLASLAFYLFSSTRLINSIKHEHSCKILYITSNLTTSIYGEEKPTLGTASASTQNGYSPDHGLSVKKNVVKMDILMRSCYVLCVKCGALRVQTEVLCEILLGVVLHALIVL